MTIAIIKQTKKSITFEVTGLNYKNQMITRKEVIKTKYDAQAFLSGLEAGEIKIAMKAIATILEKKEVAHLKSIFQPTAKQEQKRQLEHDRFMASIRSEAGQREIESLIEAMSPCLLQKREKANTQWIKENKDLREFYGI